MEAGKPIRDAPAGESGPADETSMWPPRNSVAHRRLRCWEMISPKLGRRPQPRLQPVTCPSGSARCSSNARSIFPPETSWRTKVAPAIAVASFVLKPSERTPIGALDHRPGCSRRD